MYLMTLNLRRMNKKSYIKIIISILNIGYIYYQKKEYDISTGYIGHSNISIYNILGNYKLKKLK